MTVEIWKETLKFLDYAYQVYKKESEMIFDIDKKMLTLKKANNIKKAREILFSLEFEVKEYSELKEFKALEIISTI